MTSVDLGHDLELGHLVLELPIGPLHYEAGQLAVRPNVTVKRTIDSGMPPDATKVDALLMLEHDLDQATPPKAFNYVTSWAVYLPAEVREANDDAVNTRSHRVL